MKKNKYENIQMIDLEDKVDDIISIYINRLYHTDKTIGVIVNKEIAGYILDNLIRLDETSIKEIDLVDYMNIDEYLVSVDDNGVITVVPIEDFGVLDKTDIFYIDMDGDIEQNIIDYCVNENKEVILFGQEDDCDGNCKNCNCHDETYLRTSEDEDGNTHGFTASRSDGDSYMSYSYYSSDELSHEDIQKMLKAFGF
ncbi:hypothetical protein DWZ63_10405 [Clostridium sp. AF34-13]|nr:hypothetical protein DWZ63_10405 [Clostridium sp. AF34-13]